MPVIQGRSRSRIAVILPARLWRQEGNSEINLPVIIDYKRFFLYFRSYYSKLIKEKMTSKQRNKNPLPYEVNKSKDELVAEIATSLTPDERLQKLTRMINYTKQFSGNYSKALQRRLEEGNYFILK